MEKPTDPYAVIGRRACTREGEQIFGLVTAVAYYSSGFQVKFEYWYDGEHKGEWVDGFIIELAPAEEKFGLTTKGA